MKPTNRGRMVQKPMTALHANLRTLLALRHHVHQGANHKLGQLLHVRKVCQSAGESGSLDRSRQGQGKIRASIGAIEMTAAAFQKVR